METAYIKEEAVYNPLKVYKHASHYTMQKADTQMRKTFEPFSFSGQLLLLFSPSGDEEGGKVLIR